MPNFDVSRPSKGTCNLGEITFRFLTTYFSHVQLYASEVFSIATSTTRATATAPRFPNARRTHRGILLKVVLLNIIRSHFVCKSKDKMRDVRTSVLIMIFRRTALSFKIASNFQRCCYFAQSLIDRKHAWKLDCNLRQDRIRRKSENRRAISIQSKEQSTPFSQSGNDCVKREQTEEKAWLNL